MKPKISIFLLLLLGAQSGFAQWSADPSENSPIAVMAGEEAIPKVVTAGIGTTYIGWFSIESGNYHVRLQKLDVFGAKMWNEAGLLVSSHPSMSWLTDWDMAVDHEEHAILTFQDIRTGNNNIFAYRISPDGEFVWGANGLQLSNSPTAFNVSPKVVVTDSNNVIIAWQADDVIIRQKITPAGQKLWGEDGITMSGTNTFSWPQLLAVNGDEVIMKYFEDSGVPWAPTRHVYAQRYGQSGNGVWTNPTVISNAGGISAWTQIFSFIGDGDDGCFIAWHDDRDNNMLASVFVQQINASGQAVFQANGIEASLMPGRNNFYPHLALPESTDEVFVFWNEMDGNQDNRGIYGQKLSTAGIRLWTDNGKPFVELSSTDIYGQNIQTDGTLGPVVFQTDLTIVPDSLICDEAIPHFVKIYNNTPENVVVYDIWLEEEMHIAIINIPQFPLTIVTGDSLILELWVIGGIKPLEPDQYEYDKLWVDAETGLYHVDIAINWDLLGSVANSSETEFSLKVYPNPASQFVEFLLIAKKEVNAVLEICDIYGQLVRRMEMHSGNDLVWDLSGNDGKQVSPGVYLYRIMSGDRSSSGKIIITR
jgi:hypothetical protein